MGRHVGARLVWRTGQRGATLGERTGDASICIQRVPCVSRPDELRADRRAAKASCLASTVRNSRREASNLPTFWRINRRCWRLAPASKSVY